MTTTKQRIEIERKVVRHLIRTARKHGFNLVRVWDGGENIPVETENEALDAVFAVDEATIRFRRNGDAKTHCAVIVLGNNGWDAIADSSMGEGWDSVMDEMDAYANKLQENEA